MENTAVKSQLARTPCNGMVHCAQPANACLFAFAVLQQAGPLPVRPLDPHGERRAQLHLPNHYLKPPRLGGRAQ